MPTVRLPAVLDPATGGVRRVEVAGATLGEVLEDLCRQVPTLRVHVLDEAGELRPHVAVLVDGINRRNLDRPVAPADDIAVIQAISGGSRARSH